MTDSFLVTVVDVADVSPNLRRVRLTGDSLSEWQTTGRPDEFVHVHIPGDDPQPGWEEDHDIARHYTIRRWEADARVITVDVVTHGHGRGSTWAREAKPGDVVAISTATGYYSPPADSTTRLLIADATGLPAVARILEEAGPDETFEVVVELLDLADRIPLPSAAKVMVQWRVAGNGRTPSGVERWMSRRVEPSADTYVWIACESAESRRARTYLRRHWSRHHSLFRIVGYWHLDQAEQLSRWLAMTPEQQARYAEIWDESRPDEVNWIELEPFLQEMGL